MPALICLCSGSRSANEAIERVHASAVCAGTMQLAIDERRRIAYSVFLSHRDTARDGLWW
ncbi:hypothetical protein NZD89_22970 [Alicyclobacillus fastidiosus]|uniref:Uncharacterized protein n=1 Tax=Alicyclobacillus fastidiosus TaxID=392011 RepID=A0ABY6ZEW8_9BACL|nr:hypothetical protein [Alicyclobacillus fastidiosus]WAH41103.1 hypothetical protein NZD89_22970 [Alicyclobacillus fastidiosus]